MGGAWQRVGLWAGRRSALLYWYFSAGLHCTGEGLEGMHESSSARAQALTVHTWTRHMDTFLLVCLSGILYIPLPHRVRYRCTSPAQTHPLAPAGPFALAASPEPSRCHAAAVSPPAAARTLTNQRGGGLHYLLPPALGHIPNPCLPALAHGATQSPPARRRATTTRTARGSRAAAARAVSTTPRPPTWSTCAAPSTLRSCPRSTLRRRATSCSKSRSSRGRWGRGRTTQSWGRGRWRGKRTWLAAVEKR